MISCPALGIMEWWNNGMLILRERNSFMNFAVNRNFPNPSPCSGQVHPLSHLPKTHYSLAQTCLIDTEFNELSFLDITATTACSRVVAPGRAIIPLFQYSNWGEAPKFSVECCPLSVRRYSLSVEKRSTVNG